MGAVGAWGMRDIVVARRALLAFAVGFGGSGWPNGASGAGPPARPGVRQSAKPLRVIALDPGHGGADPGAISPEGYYEKNLTLATARELARQLDATGRYRPILTRDGDRFVALRDRITRARAGHAELLLSIHADALPDSAMRGLSVYTLSDQASDRETAALAMRENRDGFIAGLRLPRKQRDIGAVLFDMARRQTNNRSLTLARAIVAELGRAVPLLERPHRAAGFVVLTAPDTPSALVELGCLSNPADERLLTQRGYQQRLAQALVHAIDDSSRPPA